MTLPLLLLVACAGGVDSASAAADTDAAVTVTYADWTRGFLTGKCQPCHAATAPERHGAPEGVTFDTYEDALALAGRIEATVLEAGTMPPSGGVTEEEAILLAAWLADPR